MKKNLFSILLIFCFIFGCGCSSSAKDTIDATTNYVATLPDGPVESSIFVSPVDNIPDDFIKGMDISSLLALEASGVKYYDFEGNEADLLKVLADAGINYVRIRVWNDPFDEEGNGYGGGNCDVNTAAEIGGRAAKYGIKTCVDFHYSDFWADPSKQMCPKAWMKYTIEEKAQAIKEYTIGSLNTIIESGADVGMVQVGNETNNGIAGVKSQANLYTMIAAGCEGVRAVSADKGMDIKVAVHFTQIDNHDDTLKKAELLKEAGASYDVFGVSYYPYWHGSFENMEQVLKDIKLNYGVDTCIMETSYPYTNADGDGFGNSISGDGDVLNEYPVSVAGQAKLVRDICNSAVNAGALGVFYWEGAWIPVGTNPSENSKLWEEQGSGWASSYASGYDPNDAGKYYGGCSWENQAMFDFEGHPLESLNVFKYLKYGATAPIEVLAIKDIKIESGVGLELNLPEEVEAIYNDSNLTEGVKVSWDEGDISKIDVNTPGKYSIKGKAENGWDVTAEVKIMSVNYIQNGSFEDGIENWAVEYDSENNPTDIQNKESDAASGTYAFHFWSPKDVEFKMYQKIENLHTGSYTASCYIQGGDMGESEEVYLFVQINGEEVYKQNVNLTGWVVWKNPIISDIEINETDEVIVGVYVKGDPGAWGTIDDFEFY